RAFTDRHHEGGWRQVGHDPKRIVTLCSSHHTARHAGQLHVAFEGDEPRFSLADGTPLDGSAGDSRDADATAELALRRLEFKASEAKSLVAAARLRLGRVASPDALIAAALRAAPGRAS